MISIYIDLAVGLILAFLLLSLLVSGINEGIVRLLNIRSKFLWAYLRDTMDGGGRTTPGEISSLRRVGGAVARAVGRALEWLSQRPMVGRIVRRYLRDFMPREDGSRLPSTVAGVFLRLPFARDPRPAASLSPAPMEIQTDHPITETFYERLQEIDHGKAGRTTIAEVPPSRFGVALMELAMGHGGVQPLLNRLRDCGSPLFRPLQSIWESVDENFDAFRAGAEKWFDGEMQRLTLLYRRYVRWVVAVLGLLVTLLFTVDSLEYGKSLLNDAAHRSAVAALADAAPDQLAGLRDQCSAGADTYTCVTEVLSTPAFVQVFGNAPVTLRVPEGDAPQLAWEPSIWWERVSMLDHWPGFLLTFVALTFGASFWWDVLRRVTGLRSRRDGSTA